MNVSNHAGRRYCERIKGIEEKSSGPYYLQNKEVVDSEISKLVEYSEEFYRGKIKMHPERVYLKQRNIIIVTSETEVVTLFKIGFGGLSENKIEEVLDIMLTDLKEKVIERDEEYDKIQEDIGAFNTEINSADKEIRRLQELIEIEKLHKEANLNYKKASQKKLTQLDYKLNDMFEAIIGKGFSSELS